MSEQEVWDALKALLSATDLGEHVYDIDMVPSTNGVPGTLPESFAVLHVERRYVPPTTAGRTTINGYRAAVSFIGRSVHNARVIGSWVRDAFEDEPGSGRVITVGGIESTPITHESSTAVAKDDDARWSGSSLWTLAL